MTFDKKVPKRYLFVTFLPCVHLCLDVTYTNNILVYERVTTGFTYASACSMCPSMQPDGARQFLKRVHEARYSLVWEYNTKTLFWACIPTISLGYTSTRRQDYFIFLAFQVLHHDLQLIFLKGTVGIWSIYSSGNVEMCFHYSSDGRGRRTGCWWETYRVFMEDVQFYYERRFSWFPFHSLYIFTSVHDRLSKVGHLCDAPIGDVWGIT
jgi:hypothetical protein